MLWSLWELISGCPGKSWVHSARMRQVHLEGMHAGTHREASVGGVPISTALPWTCGGCMAPSVLALLHLLGLDPHLQAARLCR